MTQQLEHRAAPGDTRFRPAAHQAPVPAGKLLNSADAGLLIHRVGQLKYEFREEGIGFSLDVVRLINQSQLGRISVFLYEEMFGLYNRFHWLIHMKQPNDYQRLLDMVDHDAEMHEVSMADRLPEKGGGNWERMFVQGSLREAVLVPQHGLDHGDDGGHPVDVFQPPARFQTSQPDGLLLHTANAAVIVHRTVQVRYDLRKQARYFAFDWSRYINERLAGRATVFLYEETWGLQDRIHLLIHLGTADAYWDVVQMARRDEGLRRVLGKQWVPDSMGGGGGERTFLEGTLTDTALVPYQAATGPS